jgi:hypothetical protein
MAVPRHHHGRHRVVLMHFPPLVEAIVPPGMTVLITTTTTILSTASAAAMKGRTSTRETANQDRPARPARRELARQVQSSAVHPLGPGSPRMMPTNSTNGNASTGTAVDRKRAADAGPVGPPGGVGATPTTPVAGNAPSGRGVAPDDEDELERWDREHGYGGGAQTAPIDISSLPDAPVTGPDGWPARPRWDPGSGAWVDPGTDAKWDPERRIWVDPSSGTPLTPPGDYPPFDGPDGGPARAHWDPWNKVWVEPKTGAWWDPDKRTWSDPRNGHVYPPGWTGPAMEPPESGPMGEIPHLAYDPQAKRWYDPLTGAFWDPENEQWSSPFDRTPYCPGDPFPGLLPPLLGPFSDPTPAVWDPASGSWVDPGTGARWDPDRGSWVDPLTHHPYGPGDPQPPKYPDGSIDRPFSVPSGGHVPPYWDPVRGQWYDPVTGQHYDPKRTDHWYSSPDDHAVDDDDDDDEPAAGAALFGSATGAAFGASTDGPGFGWKIPAAVGSVAAVAAAVILAVTLSGGSGPSTHKGAAQGSTSASTVRTATGTTAVTQQGATTSTVSGASGSITTTTAKHSASPTQTTTAKATAPGLTTTTLAHTAPTTTTVVHQATTTTTTTVAGPPPYAYDGAAIITLSSPTGPNCSGLPSSLTFNNATVHIHTGTIVIQSGAPYNENLNGTFQDGSHTFDATGSSPVSLEVNGVVNGKSLTGTASHPSSSSPQCTYQVNGTLS